MKRLFDIAIFPIRLGIGVLLFILSPGFRATVRAKLRAGNDPVNTGEQVIAVLATDNGKTKFIGGKP